MPPAEGPRGPEIIDVPRIGGTRRAFMIRGAVLGAIGLVLASGDSMMRSPESGSKATRFEDLDPREPVLGRRVLFRVPSEHEPLPDVEVQLFESGRGLMIRIDGLTYEFGDDLGGQEVHVARTIRRDGGFLKATHALGTGRTSADDVGGAAHLVRAQSGDESGIVRTQIAGSFQLHFCRESRGTHPMTLRRRTDMDQRA